MQKVLLPILAVCISFGGANAGQKAFIVEGFDTPESVAYDGEYYYVSNMGKLKPTAKDGDGYISRLSTDGKVIDKHWAPKKGFINSPKGLVINDGVLYVADVDRLIGFDIKTGKQVYLLDLAKEKTLFLNALARRDEKTLFLSSSDTGKIFEIMTCCVDRYSTLVAGINGPNGLSWDDENKKLYVAEWGSGKPDGGVGVIDIEDGAKHKYLSDHRGFLDGAVLLDAKTLLFSDWVDFKKVGKLHKLDIASGKMSDVKLMEPIGGPSDFYHNKKAGQLVIPMMMEGKIMFVPFGG